MGKIKVSFQDERDGLKYGINKIQEINLEGQDFNIDFPDTSIDWDSINYPNEKIKGKILEIIYFTGLSNQLKEISNKIKLTSSIDDLSTYANSANHIMKGMKSSQYFKEVYMGDEISRIEYTLRKNVSQIPDEKPKKNGEAKRDYERTFSKASGNLVLDIDSLTNRLDSFNVNIEI